LTLEIASAVQLISEAAPAVELKLETATAAQLIQNPHLLLS
jgi:hypothetical protein